VFSGHRGLGATPRGREMTPPLVLDARGELLFFRSAESLEGYVEEIDIENGEYGHCWDAEGRLLALAVRPREVKILGFVSWQVRQPSITQTEADPRHAAELRSALVSFLEALGTRALGARSLAELIELGSTRCGLT
jgi:hypothetical protein